MRTRALLNRLATVPLAVASLLIGVCPTWLPAQGPANPVVPGVAVHAAAPLRADTVVYERTITRAGKDSVSGTRTVVSRVVDGRDHMSLLEIEQRFPAAGGEIVDTAIGELRTLRAVSHRSHQPTRSMRFDFVGDDALGTITESSAAGSSRTPAQTIRQPLGGAIFDSNIIDLVVASLALDRNLAVDLPFFIYERGGRVPMAVAVRDRAMLPFGKLGDRDAWIVSVAVPGAPATVWVDVKTREVLRVRYDIAARGVSFTDDRVTRLRG